MSVIAAMWSQSIPCRKPNQNAATSRPNPKALPEKLASSPITSGRTVRHRGRAPGAQPGDGEMREVRFEPPVPAAELLERLRLRHRQGVLGAASAACQMDVLALGSMVVFGAGFEVGVGEDAQLLQEVEGPVDRRRIDSRE